MHIFGYKIQQFYRRKGNYFFEELYQQVNRQALAPFFRLWFHRKGLILDAGSGSGHLAETMGFSNACFLDLTWEKIKRCKDKRARGQFIQGDIQHLPFQNNVFDEVICSNVLHYTGLAGLKELLRVTKSGGQLLLAFLENSELTQWATHLAVFWGLFPSLMREAQFIDLAELAQLNIQIVDSSTVVFLPPFFQAFRKLPRKGLVVFVLKKLRKDSSLSQNNNIGSIGAS
jgi:SAM-dependent methyltransferase